MFTSLYSLFRPSDLEHLSDSEFARLAMRAETRRGDAIWVIPLAVGFVSALAWLGFGLGLAWLLSRGAPINWARIGLLNVLLCAMITGVVSAIVRWRMLNDSIRSIINKAACPYCEFSFIGLKPELGGVVCPECGERTTLAELDITPFELLPHSAPPPPGPIGAGPLGAYIPVSAGTTKRIKHQRTGMPFKRTSPPSSTPGGDFM